MDNDGDEEHVNIMRVRKNDYTDTIKSDLLSE